jgi:hypothetical protein
MDRFHPPIELLLGNNDNRPATLPRDMERRAAVPNLIHVSGEPLTEIGIGHMTWFGFFSSIDLGHV